MRLTQLSAFIVLLLFVGAWITLFVSTYEFAKDVYARTPEVDNFRGFVDPDSTRYDSKHGYLISPVLFMGLMVAVGTIYAVWRYVWEVRKGESGYAFAPWVWNTFIIVLFSSMMYVQLTAALRAAGPH